MSFEVYLQCFDSGEPAGVPRTAVRGLFPVVEAESEADYWFVRYDDLNTCNIGVRAMTTDPELLESLYVSRPCSDQRLWAALLATMRLGNVVLYFPGCRCPLVAAEAAVAHLPAGLTQSLGQPLVVGTAEGVIEMVCM